MAGLALLLCLGAARADEFASAAPEERMNAMAAIWYGPYNGFSFEYDLIAQFWKSREWKGNITGPYLSEEIGWESNRFGIGFVTGQRIDQKGTFAGAVTFFGENRWEHFSRTEMGAEARLSLFIFATKLGLVNNWNKLYWQVGLSY